MGEEIFWFLVFVGETFADNELLAGICVACWQAAVIKRIIAKVKRMFLIFIATPQ